MNGVQQEDSIQSLKGKAILGTIMAFPLNFYFSEGTGVILSLLCLQNRHTASL